MFHVKRRRDLCPPYRGARSSTSAPPARLRGGSARVACGCSACRVVTMTSQRAAAEMWDAWEGEGSASGALVDRWVWRWARGVSRETSPSRCSRAQAASISPLASDSALRPHPGAVCRTGRRPMCGLGQMCRDTSTPRDERRIKEVRDRSHLSRSGHAGLDTPRHFPGHFRRQRACSTTPSLPSLRQRSLPEPPTTTTRCRSPSRGSAGSEYVTDSRLPTEALCLPARTAGFWGRGELPLDRLSSEEELSD